MKKHLLLIILWGIFLTAGFLIAYVPIDQQSGVANVRSYGAFGNGVSNDTAAVQAAAYSGLPVFFPTGSYLLDQVNITNATVVYGAGARFESSTGGTLILPHTSTTTVFYVNSHAPVTFRDFNVQGSGGNTVGAAIDFDDTNAADPVKNLFSTVDNVVFDALWIGVSVIRASAVHFHHSSFQNILGFGVTLDNIFNKDQGDCEIDGCGFSLALPTAAGIGWLGGGGARIVNNKCIGSPFFTANLAGVTSNGTGQLTINDNNLDGITTNSAAIAIFNTGGVNSFYKITINGNLFSGSSLSEDILILGGAAAPIGDVTIVGNTMTLLAGNFCTNQYAVYLDYVTGFTIAGNTIRGANTLCTGVNTTSNCFAGLISGNVITNWGNAAITTNASISPSVHIGGNY